MIYLQYKQRKIKRKANIFCFIEKEVSKNYIPQ